MGSPSDPDAASEGSAAAEPSQAHPWATRQERIYDLQNQLDREDLDEGTALAVREQLAALADPDLSESEQVQRWEKIRKLAPQFWDRTADVVQGLATAFVKQQLGI